MQNFHLIEARYMGPTNTRGSRVKLVSARFEQSKSIPYDHTFNSAKDIAIDYLEKEGHAVVGSGEVGNHFVIVVAATDNKFKPLKEVKA